MSDETGWWNVYAENAGQWVSIAPDDAEFGVPQWVFGLSTYTFLAVGRIAAVALREDREDLGVIESGSGRWLDCRRSRWQRRLDSLYLPALAPFLGRERLDAGRLIVAMSPFSPSAVC